MTILVTDRVNDLIKDIMLVAKRYNGDERDEAVEGVLEYVCENNNLTYEDSGILSAIVWELVSELPK